VFDTTILTFNRILNFDEKNGQVQKKKMSSNEAQTKGNTQTNQEEEGRHFEKS
jgi:hypothetical protein